MKTSYRKLDTMSSSFGSSFEVVNNDRARAIIEMEDHLPGAIFFRVYVDPSNAPSDAEALPRLEYQSAKRFYLLTRCAH